MQIDNFIKKLVPTFVIKRLEGRPNLQKIITNTGWLFFDKVIRMGVGLFVGVWVARYLGPEKYGVLSYVISFVSILSVMNFSGLETIVVRDVISSNKKLPETLGSSFVIRLLGGACALLLTIILMYLVRPNDPLIRSMGMIISLGTIFQAFDIIGYWFQSQIQSKFTVIVKSAAFILGGFLKMFLILIKAPLLAFAWVMFLESFAGAFGLIIFYKLNQQEITAWRASIKRVKDLFKDSWPLFLSSVVVILYMRIDQIMLAHFKGETVVGIYSAAVKLAEVWYFVPVAIVSSVYPVILKYKNNLRELYIRRIQDLYDLLVTISIIICLAISFLSKQIVVYIYGHDYIEAHHILVILTWAGLFIAMSISRSKWIIAEGLIKYTFLTQFLGTMTNIILNIVLIPRFGAIGAAYATVISYAIAGYLSSFVFKPLFISGVMLTKSIFVLLRIDFYRKIYRLIKVS